ncbi:hypothetical protein [Cupriavidus nantongensis]|uniref:hypothetical protein n=1 Tax=Cupriavidus nantongensis TaxID=1796606 RepID=UPI001237197E|nr:hypothetical protein [Cupriavidus nantongensis]
MKIRRIRKVEQFRNRVITDKLVIGSDWVPSAPNINALPKPLRDFIVRLYAYDPQHYVQKVAVLQEHIRMLEADNKRLRNELGWCRKALGQATDGGSAPAKAIG